MAFESWPEVWTWAKTQLPDLFVKRRFNFITIHYLYMIGMSILISVILYGQGGMAYIDALFFAAGACTQSGLNTVDVNKIHTGQQAALYVAAMFCNPIVIHSFVVFVRLYWFEKRFKDVVREARAIRRTKSRSKYGTTEKQDPELGRKETGVRGKAISVLRNTGRFSKSNDEDRAMSEEKDVAEDTSSGDIRDHHSSDSEPREDPVELARTQSSGSMRLPQQLSSDQHIRFLEMQRNPSESGALYIPSPREFERGGRPAELDEIEPGIPRRVTSDLEDHSNNALARTGTNVRQHITIDEPEIHRTRDKTSTFPRSGSRQRVQYMEGDPPSHTSRPKRANTFGSMRRTNTGRSVEQTPYLSWQPTVGRNSFFVGLTEEQREELGGIEYRALKTLALVLTCYFFLFHLLGLISLLPWVARSSKYQGIIDGQGIGWPWWGIFTAQSAFNDLGFTLTNNSMISFQFAVWPMLIMTFLIIIGNTGFPCMLRFVIWATSKVVPVGSGVWEELQFLLDHPRRCFTLLFPRGATWWLFAILAVLNGIDLVFFIILDLKDQTVTGLPPGIRVLVGLFQAASTRTAGFSAVNIADLHPAIQVSYLIMMYISVFPIAISMRRTNVYEEKSLGIYGSQNDQDEDAQNANEPSYVGAHLRRQLSFDLWYVFLGLFIIAIVEGNRLQPAKDYAFNLFSCLFEIVSAYGTVGLSIGYPTINASFSAEFKVLSKLVIVSMMIRGRHRGLPYELDRAILLPSESLQAKEEKEGKRILSRRRSSLSAMSTTSAVDGQLDSNKFRPETGLSSGYEGNEYGNDSLEARVAKKHSSRARSGLGTVLFKLASATHPDTIPEERSRTPSR